MERFRAARHFLWRSSRFLIQRGRNLSSENLILGSAHTRPYTVYPSRNYRVLGEANAIQYRFFATEAEKVQRSPSFSTLNSDDISYFKGVLGEKYVIQDEDTLEFANTDWMRKYKGSSKLLLQPRSTEEVYFYFFDTSF